jgi:DNA topoisomerase IA
MSVNIDQMQYDELKKLQEVIENKIKYTVFPFTIDELINKALLSEEINPDSHTSEEEIKQALKALYEAGYISYPYTQDKRLPFSLFDMSSKTIISVIQNRFEENPLQKINSIRMDIMPLSFSTKDIHHHGIIPMDKYLGDKIPDIQYNLLKIISQRYLEIFINK